MDALIHLSDVSKRYDNDGKFAVEDVSLTVAAGEAVAVMGPSGSGNSTLLNLAGLDRPTAGTVTVAGQRIDSLSETGLARYRRRRVGMSRLRAHRRADQLLDRLGISQHRNSYPARLSGGERQRVAIARAARSRTAVALRAE